ncbi:MAG: enoyl-CoA hydratase/isomerase family protein [Chloroflexota bacterium]|nr:enoyl-CoA hydratase/isomerase family protein [Chloroflexota bacterium]
MKNYKNLSFRVDDHIGLLTLDRPEVMNALNRELTLEFHELLDELPGKFPEIRVLVITGNGKAFCSGADLSRMGASGSENRRNRDRSDQSRRRIQELAPAIRNLPQPVVSAINGAAVGAGLSIALATDIRIATEKARFSAIFVKRGLVPDTAASATIKAIAGHGIAAEMSLTGKIYDAEWALSKGLVNEVVDPASLLDKCMEVAREIAANPPLAVRQTKQLLRVRMEDWHQIISDEDSAGEMLYDTEDQKEAVRAFLEKRKPKYIGK